MFAITLLMIVIANARKLQNVIVALETFQQRKALSAMLKIDIADRAFPIKF
jgi:hypothetical protein